MVTSRNERENLSLLKRSKDNQLPEKRPKNSKTRRNGGKNLES
jgi:hypothetical protein